MTGPEFLKVFNFCEAIFWFVYAFVCWKLPLFPKDQTSRRRTWVAITFIFLGFSDLVEMNSGGWWKPWWLLVWKGTCVIIVLYWFRFYPFINKDN
ncbi:MAG: hypothetical protein H6753_06040 [Candidatus Omnitrophica bacterium]|nr:hypothetical protein [Candidatus Omnitrophota bacterium]